MRLQQSPTQPAASTSQISRIVASASLTLLGKAYLTAPYEIAGIVEQDRLRKEWRHA
jgi:hypothetical protein